jgi:hypothetical protein
MVLLTRSFGPPEKVRAGHTLSGVATDSWDPELGFGRRSVACAPHHMRPWRPGHGMRPHVDADPMRTSTERLVSSLSRRWRGIVFYIVIFGGLAIVLVVAFFMKWSQRNNWPDDE